MCTTLTVLWCRQLATGQSFLADCRGAEGLTREGLNRPGRLPSSNSARRCRTTCTQHTVQMRMPTYDSFSPAPAQSPGAGSSGVMIVRRWSVGLNIGSELAYPIKRAGLPYQASCTVKPQPVTPNAQYSGSPGWPALQSRGTLLPKRPKCTSSVHAGSCTATLPYAASGLPRHESQEDKQP